MGMESKDKMEPGENRREPHHSGYRTKLALKPAVTSDIDIRSQLSLAD